MNDVLSKYHDTLHVGSVAVLVTLEVLLVSTVENASVKLESSAVSTLSYNCHDSIGVVSCG